MIRMSRGRVALLLLMVLVYALTMYRNLYESERRTLELRRYVADDDRILVTIDVVGVDMQRSELTARMSFRVRGAIAQDELTPSVDLKLLLNSIRGSQYVEFGRGKRLNPIEVVFPLGGDSNRYPFDVRPASLALMFTRPGRSSSTVQAQLAGTAALAGPAEFERREPVALSIDLFASIPGVSFKGEILDTAGGAQTEIHLKLRRADNLIVVSVVIMAMMLGLAFSLSAMVLYATQRGRETVLLPLSVAVSLIFGLPALRNTQPGVPPLAVFSDYLVFIWAEATAAGCTVIVIWTWIAGTHRRAIAKAAEEVEQKP